MDFVIEWRGALLPVEVKAASHPTLDDARHLRAFREDYRDAARAGLLLHTGDRTGWISPGIFAAPWWSGV